MYLSTSTKVLRPMPGMHTHTDAHTDRHRHTHTDTYRHIHECTHTNAARPHTRTHACTHTHTHKHRQTDRQTHTYIIHTHRRSFLTGVDCCSPHQSYSSSLYLCTANPTVLLNHLSHNIIVLYLRYFNSSFTRFIQPPLAPLILRQPAK